MIHSDHLLALVLFGHRSSHILPCLSQGLYQALVYKQWHFPHSLTTLLLINNSNFSNFKFNQSTHPAVARLSCLPSHQSVRPNSSKKITWLTLTLCAIQAK